MQVVVAERGLLVPLVHRRVAAAGPPPPAGRDPTELLHVHVHQVTRRPILVAALAGPGPDSLPVTRSSSRSTGSPCRRRIRPIVDAGTPSIADSVIGPTRCRRRAAITRRSTVAGVRPGQRPGVLGRSSSAASPPAW